MKLALWSLAGLVMLAGIAANRVSAGAKDSDPVSKSLEIPAKYRQRFHWVIEYRLGTSLQRTVKNLQTSPTDSDRRFGMYRNPVFVGPHETGLGQDLVAFGNKTNTFDPDSWRIVRTIQFGIEEVVNAPPSWEESAREIAPLFQSGVDEPLRWKDEHRHFEARAVRFSSDACLICHPSGKVGGVAAIVMNSIPNHRVLSMIAQDDAREERLKKYDMDRESLARKNAEREAREGR